MRIDIDIPPELVSDTDSESDDGSDIDIPPELTSDTDSDSDNDSNFVDVLDVYSRSYLSAAKL